MAEMSVKDFEERLNSSECSQELRDIVAILRQAARGAGEDVEPRAHSTQGSGWGITYKRGTRVFCQFDPKPTALHVGADVRGADEAELQKAGRLHRRKNGKPWVHVEDANAAKKLVPLIHRAYEQAGITIARHK